MKSSGVLVLCCLGGLALAVWVDDGGRSPAPAALAVETRPADPEGLEEAEELLEEARTLTPTEIVLDEQARDLWLPRLASLQAQAQDPTVSPQEREVLRRIMAELAAVGL